jgi:predicted nuclease with TOPRIM domain
LQQRLEQAQKTPLRVREAEAQLQAEHGRIESLLQENAALSERAQHLQLAVAQLPDLQSGDLVSLTLPLMV